MAPELVEAIARRIAQTVILGRAPEEIRPSDEILIDTRWPQYADAAEAVMLWLATAGPRPLDEIASILPRRAKVSDVLDAYFCVLLEQDQRE